MLSLAGIPPLAGFAGKFYLFSGAVQSGYLWLAFIGLIMSMISVLLLFAGSQSDVYRRGSQPDEKMEVSGAARLAMWMCLLGTIFWAFTRHLYPICPNCHPVFYVNPQF
jgi:NADH-quinone oxidoreductase subunit N